MMLDVSRVAALLCGSLASLVAQDAGGSAPDFERDVLPILESRCFECHRASYRDERGRMRSPKGGLRLDGRAWIERGGDGGEAVVAGEPDESPLYTRTILDPDDIDIMPETGEALTAAQTDTLKRWIVAGASFGDWTGAAAGASSPAGGESRVPARHALYARLAANLRPPARSALRKALGEHGRAEPLDDEGRLLRVSFPAHQGEVDADVVDRLEQIGPNVVELDLRRCRVDDLGALRRMRNLVRLDLAETPIEDRELRSLAGLEELRSLSLVKTAITDRGLQELAGLPALERLYLWRSKATAKGVRRLLESRPDLRVVLRADLPGGTN